MKQVTLLLLMCITSLLAFAQCPQWVNTNVENSAKLALLVENAAGVKLNLDTISSLNVYYYSTDDKSTTMRTEILRGKKEVGDTAINMTSKIMKIDIVAPAVTADKIFAAVRQATQDCSRLKKRSRYIKFNGETASIDKVPSGEASMKKITISPSR